MEFVSQRTEGTEKQFSDGFLESFCGTAVLSCDLLAVASRETTMVALVDTPVSSGRNEVTSVVQGLTQAL